MKAFLFSTFLVTAMADITSPLAGRRSGSLIQFETTNQDPSLFQLVEDALIQYNKNIDLKLESVKKICQQRTEVTLSTDEEAKLERKKAEFEDVMLRYSNKTAVKIHTEISAALEGALEKLDSMLQPIRSEISDLKNEISTAAKKEDLDNLENILVDVAFNATMKIKEELEKLLTKEDMAENHEQLLSKLEEAFTKEDESTCEDSSKLEEILEKLDKSDRDLEQVVEHLRNDSLTTMCSSTIAGMTDLVGKLDENSQLVTSLDTMVQSMQKEFLDKLEELHTLTDEHQQRNEIDDQTQTINSVSSSRKITPVECKDSNFVGTGRSLNICQAAVRFQKCHLEFVAFHCCRSCQDSGLLTSLPHYTGPRTVPVLQALRSLRPFS